MAKPEHDARREPTKRQHRRTRGWKAPSAPRWCSRRSRNTSWFDVKVDRSDCANMCRNVRPRLRSQIGEVLGSLKRNSLAREAVVRSCGGAGGEPSSSPTSKAATHDTIPASCATRDYAAVHGGAGKGSSSWSPKAPPPHGTKRPLLAAAAEPPPEASVTPPASKRRKKVVRSPQPPTITPADLILKALHDVPERRIAEPEVLVRASQLKSRFAGLIAKAAETLSIRHRQDLERRPATDMDQGSHGAEAEGEAALRQEEERNARVGALRKKAREELQEVEKNGRHTGLSVETIHQVHLVELGISAVEHVVSPARSRDGALPTTAPKNRRRRSPLEELGLFVKPVDDSGDDTM